jgi:hypothetical protein
MKKSRHTPGPWHIIKAHSSGEVITIADGLKKICDLEIEVKNPNGPENWRTARLISAAPELLETLERIVEQVQSTKPGDNPIEVLRVVLMGARVAIGKAKGGAE